MSDDRIREYLRSRSDGLPPPDLFGAISESVAARDQEGRSPFAPFIPAAAGLALTAAVIVGAILLTQPNVGPPSESAAPSISTPDPSVVSRPSPTPERSADAVGPLTIEGASVSFEPVDSDGAWGSGELIRGRDITRYAGFEVPGTYLLEVFVRYEAQRVPQPAQFGASDWSLRPTDPGATYYFSVEPINGQDRDELEPWPGPDPMLGQYPGAIDVLTTPTEGWMVFQVDSRTLDYPLELVYHPAGGAVRERTFIVRTPDDPAPIAGETPPPRPGDPVYVEQPGLPFTVLNSGAADELFGTPDTCSNPEAGYTVTFPDDWYTNTAFGDQPACIWFSPGFFTVDAAGEPNPPVWITFQFFEESGYGYIGTTVGHYYEELPVDGRNARRFEYTSYPMSDPDQRSYDYVVALGDPPEEFGPTLVATVNSARAADYELAKAVLDRIMVSLVFDR